RNSSHLPVASAARAACGHVSADPPRRFGKRSGNSCGEPATYDTAAAAGFAPCRPAISDSETVGLVRGRKPPALLTLRRELAHRAASAQNARCRAVWSRIWQVGT